MRKLLIIAGNARSLVANRRDLIRAIQEQGWTVEALVPEDDYLDDVQELGILIHIISLGRTGINPMSDLKSIIQMKSKIKEIKPEVVFSYTVKPVIFGTLSARLAGVERCYSMVTGLGYVYTTVNFRTRCLKFLVSLLYKLSFSLNKKVFFQNPDDISDFEDAGIIKSRSKVVRTYGSGIALDRFQVAELPDKPLTFLFIGRLLTEKGISEFCKAAKQIKQKFPDVKFVAVGPYNSSLPHAIAEKDLITWKNEGVVEFIGNVSDVRPYISECHVFVLPSYREGTPRAVLEAMAMQRAIITSDAPGCRETVVHGENGFLVPVRNVDRLAYYMEQFVVNPSLIEKMGVKSRHIVEELYDVNHVNALMLESMKLNSSI